MKLKDVPRVGKLYELWSFSHFKTVNDILEFDPISNNKSVWVIAGIVPRRGRGAFDDKIIYSEVKVEVPSKWSFGLVLERKEIFAMTFARFILNDSIKGPIDLWIPRSQIGRAVTKSRMRYFEKLAEKE